MANYVVLDADWLDRQIENARILREHAQDTGKPVAIAAASVRHESLREIRRLAVPALPAGKGPVGFSLAEAPSAPTPSEE